MKKIFLAVLFGTMWGAVSAGEIYTSTYSLTDETFEAVSSPAFQLLNECDGFYKYGYSCHKIATIEASVGRLDDTGILSVDPFIREIRKSAATIGANAILMGDTYTIVKNTEAYLKMSATAYRVVNKNGQLYFSHYQNLEYIFPENLNLANKALEEKETLDKLEALPYYNERQRLLEKGVDIFLNKFFMVYSSAGVVGIDTRISDLSEQQLDKLEKFIKRIPADTIRETMARDGDLFWKEVGKISIPMLKKLREQYPRDYVEFRGLYKTAHSNEPAEHNKPTPAKTLQTMAEKK